MRPILVIARQTIAMHFNNKWIHAAAALALGLLCFTFFLATLTSATSRVKVMLDFGLGIGSLAGIVFAIFLGLNSVHGDLKNKVLYFFLAKPVSRWSFLLGRYIGGLFVLLCLYLVLGSALWLGVTTSNTISLEGFWQCLILMFFEGGLVFLLSIGSALLLSSTTLSGLFAVLMVLVGRSNHLLFELSEKATSQFTKDTFRILHDLLPALQRFDVRALVAYQRPFDDSLVWMGSAYFACYSLFFLLLAGMFFQKKDIP